MAFWAAIVKPGSPYTHSPDDPRGRLRITQAALGKRGGSSPKSQCTLECKVGDMNPVILCHLSSEKLLQKMEVEFDEDNDVVFSVAGHGSVHLVGHFVDSGHHPCGHGDEFESDGEEGTGTESDASSDDDESDEFDIAFDHDDSEDDEDLEMFSASPRRPNSGVVIEEILDDEKLVNGKDKKNLQKKKIKKDSDNGVDSSQRQIVVKGNNETEGIESEDEDGFPISSSLRNKIEQKPVDEALKKGMKKRKTDDMECDDGRDAELGKKGNMKKKKEKAMKERSSGSTDAIGDKPAEGGTHVADANLPGGDLKEIETADTITDEIQQKRKKKKNKKGKVSKDVSNTETKESDVVKVDKEIGSVKETEMEKSKVRSKARTYSNGMVIEDLLMGQPNGKRASAGSKVSVFYIGKLQNGKIFDSNIGQRPFKFRLGVGQVIKGWDVGVTGMRIGDKRRLTIPPSMGYGSKSMGRIPGNSWLLFDVELVDVQ
ncbi:Peptidyl-prolyl cis-trans isomerase FKBP53 [Acorus calamus]|uniref:FK506-binding protein n=1 Tax=Acorus calamus TaxID=4465 RepID=A0AAV9CCG9_ACOCL|nr:Peptidyl-prolyl cis-trans isomerase FKBP53 [Acorus calamus]